MRHYQTAQGSREIAHGENTECLELADPIRNPRRKEQVANCICKENENNKVVEFKDASQGSEPKRLVILWSQTGKRRRHIKLGVLFLVKNNRVAKAQIPSTGCGISDKERQDKMFGRLFVVTRVLTLLFLSSVVLFLLAMAVLA